MSQLTILIAAHDSDTREFLATQLDADGHIVHEADSPAAATAKLATHEFDILILGQLARPADTGSLLRKLRAAQLHTRIHPAQPVITIGADDELATLRAYQAGSDHHLADATSYLVARAVIDTVARRSQPQTARRHLHVGDLDIDTAARRAEIGGRAIRLSPTEYELLTTLASDPARVFTKAELTHAVWGHTRVSGRGLDGHIARLRQRLADAGAQLIHNRWGTGWSLTGGD